MLAIVLNITVQMKPDFFSRRYVLSPTLFRIAHSWRYWKAGRLIVDLLIAFQFSAHHIAPRCLHPGGPLPRPCLLHSLSFLYFIQDHLGSSPFISSDRSHSHWNGCHHHWIIQVLRYLKEGNWPSATVPSGLKYAQNLLTHLRTISFRWPAALVHERGENGSGRKYVEHLSS